MGSLFPVRGAGGNREGGPPSCVEVDARAAGRVFLHRLWEDEEQTSDGTS